MNTFDEMNNAFSYNSKTGIIVWKIRKRGTYGKGMPAGKLTSAGYVQLCLNYKRIYAHRVAFLLVNGRWPKHQIDHINGNRADNRWVNLREATPRDNQKNQECHRSGKLPGCTYIPDRNIWRAGIQIAGKKKYLGCFKTEHEAHTAYVRAFYIACEIDELNRKENHV